MIYLDNFKRLRQHCVNIVDLLYRKVNDLYRHMQSINVAAEVFLHGWLLALMGNCIPLEHMHAVVEKFRKDGWRFIYRLVITYLLCMK